MPKKLLKTERLNTFNLLTHLRSRTNTAKKNLTPQKNISPYADSLAESNCYCSWELLFKKSWEKFLITKSFVQLEQNCWRLRTCSFERETLLKRETTSPRLIAVKANTCNLKVWDLWSESIFRFWTIDMKWWQNRRDSLPVAEGS